MTHVWVDEDTVVDLVIDGVTVTTTEDHPFWSQTDKRFERADELHRGELVLTADGRLLRVGGIAWMTTRRAAAYNLTVAGVATFHVSPHDILVHNTGADCKLWTITKAGTAATRTGPYGKLYKSKSDDLWWSRDTAGHGGSHWKVYSESRTGLTWRADADEFGNFLSNKHKSDTGMFIPWKEIN